MWHLCCSVEIEGMCYVAWRLDHKAEGNYVKGDYVDIISFYIFVVA
jgi:hypothetical protein